MKENASPQPILLSDYTPPPFWVDEVHLYVDLNDGLSTVSNRMSLRRNVDCGDNAALQLDGRHLNLVSIAIDGHRLEAGDYQLDDQTLTIDALPDRCTVTVVTQIEPEKNTALEGLYRSSGNYCTQCEAQGFRRITYYLDRPDVLAKFTVTIEAEEKRYPVLLSNGNCVERTHLDNGRHLAKWCDPHPKPSYLFALVAGDLVCMRDAFATASGRDVALEIYVEPHNLELCEHAMRSLKKAMHWDEQRFGLEYDLDVYMIVAVDDFNMGAMENKGLNIFNSKFVLANQYTATDTDFQHIEGVIAHEYFHNWTGNRITCRDWFQLSLKEGLTVFRDQQFSADMNSAAVKRIEDVRLLRERQFPEDAGPTAHPIRPEAYIEINNFYTATVYEKGAEVIRMLHTLQGEEGFRRGMDLYFERHDGDAVTCDDFVNAMRDANDLDVSVFKRWYSQAGTPELQVDMDYNVDDHTCTLRFNQSTPTQPDNLPHYIPVKLSLFDPQGNAIPLHSDVSTGDRECLLSLTKAQQSLIFKRVTARPVASLLRGFSAPVKLRYDYSHDELAFLMTHETDPFNRWQASQEMVTTLALQLLEARSARREMQIPKYAIDAFASLLEHVENDALLAESLHLPSEESIGDRLPLIDIEGLFAVRQFLLKQLAQHLQAPLLATYQRCQDNRPFDVSAASMGKRRLKNTCLALLAHSGGSDIVQRAVEQFDQADNMTDEIAALRVVVDSGKSPYRACLDRFYHKWQDQKLVVDKWFSLQAMSQREDTLETVKTLAKHTAFDLQNPNRARALLATFSILNPVRFHASDGQGYQFLTDYIIELDKFNPSIAARMTTALSRWRRFTPALQTLMTEQLRRLLAVEGLSNDVYELVKKSLQQP